jgi:hypothetical protein
VEDLAPHVIAIFRTPFGQDWVETTTKRPDYLPEEGQPQDSISVADRGVSFNEPYHPDRAPKYQPIPPDAYKTWAEAGQILSVLPNVKNT